MIQVYYYKFFEKFILSAFTDLYGLYIKVINQTKAVQCETSAVTELFLQCQWFFDSQNVYLTAVICITSESATLHRGNVPTNGHTMLISRYCSVSILQGISLFILRLFIWHILLECQDQYISINL